MSDLNLKNSGAVHKDNSSAEVKAILEVDSKVFQQLKYGNVWTNDHDFTNHYDGLLSALRDRDGNRPTYIDDILTCLKSEDLLVRTGAVAVLSEIAGDLQEDFFVNLLQTHLKLFRGVKPEFTIAYEDLEQSALLAVIRLLFANANQNTLNYLKDIAQNRPWGWMVVSTIAKFDSDWVLAHAELVNKKDLSVLFVLPHSKRCALVKSLAPYPPEVTEPAWQVQIRESAWKSFSVEEAKELKTLMWPK